MVKAGEIWRGLIESNYNKNSPNIYTTLNSIDIIYIGKSWILKSIYETSWVPGGAYWHWWWRHGVVCLEGDAGMKAFADMLGKWKAEEKASANAQSIREETGTIRRGGGTTLTPANKKVLLDKHNSLRRNEPDQANMEMLVCIMFKYTFGYDNFVHQHRHRHRHQHARHRRRHRQHTSSSSACVIIAIIGMRHRRRHRHASSSPSSSSAYVIVTVIEHHGASLIRVNSGLLCSVGPHNYMGEIWCILMMCFGWFSERGILDSGEGVVIPEIDGINTDRWDVESVWTVVCYV